MNTQERRTDYVQIHSSIAELKVLVQESRGDTKDLKEFLLGNGQPGIIEKMDNRLNTIEESWAQFKGWSRGVTAVVAAIITLTGVAIAIIELFG